MDRYEALRASRNASREREFFIDRGMMAWMEVWSECSSACGVQVECGAGEQAPHAGDCEYQPAVPVDLRAEVAELLVGIAWAAARS